MPPRVEALVEPELLIWARKNAGYRSLDEAAAKAGIAVANLTAWEAGLGRPSIPQLRKLARTYGRPIAVFYLPEPPIGFKPIKDFRVVWGTDHVTTSPELVAEIRAENERREIALELLEDAGERPPRFPLSVTLEDDPEDIASRLRATIAVDLYEHHNWRDAREAFNAWRFGIEARGVLVGQMTDVARTEARGFSIAERDLPVIVANNEDHFVARAFTLAHELTHVALHASGVCDLGDHAGVERFCNHVAGAILVPRRALLDEQIVRDHGTEPEWTDADIRRLATAYRVSREVVVRRLLILGRTDERFYTLKRDEFAREREEREARSSDQQSGWGPSPATMAVVRSGHHYARIVLAGHSRGSITFGDVAEYLGVRAKHVPSVERAVYPARG